jgi:hypothetical protein
MTNPVPDRSRLSIAQNGNGGGTFDSFRPARCECAGPGFCCALPWFPFVLFSIRSVSFPVDSTLYFARTFYLALFHLVPRSLLVTAANLRRPQTHLVSPAIMACQASPTETQFGTVVTNTVTVSYSNVVSTVPDRTETIISSCTVTAAKRQATGVAAPPAGGGTTGGGTTGGGTTGGGTTGGGTTGGGTTGGGTTGGGTTGGGTTGGGTTGGGTTGGGTTGGGTTGGGTTGGGTTGGGTTGGGTTGGGTTGGGTTGGGTNPGGGNAPPACVPSTSFNIIPGEYIYPSFLGRWNLLISP